MIRQSYETRFIKQSQAAELLNDFHCSRGRGGRHVSMVNAAKAFSKRHNEISPIKAYKDLEGLLSDGNCSSGFPQAWHE